MNKTLLAVETATAACSVALLHEGKAYHRFELQPQKHAHRVLEMVDELLNEVGIKGEAIDALAFGEGPGAFTGIRIAAGVIQGLALGWNKPVIAVSSLEAIAEEVVSLSHALVLEDMPVHWCAMMDARMQEVYLLFGSYKVSHSEWQVQEAQLVSPQVATQLIVKQAEFITNNHGGAFIGLGDIQAEYPGLVSLFDDWHTILPSALAVARLASHKVDSARSIEQSVPVPVYLRNHVADTIAERKLKASMS